MKNMKIKNLMIIILVLVAFLGIIELYQTFAINSDITDDVSGATYSVYLNNNSTVNVTSGQSKTVYYKLTNTNLGTVKYGIGYSGDNITVKAYDDSFDTASGTIGEDENKFVKLYIKNTGTSNSIVTLTTVLGYENGGDLVAPNGVTLVTETCIDMPIVSYINNIYSTNTTVTNNNIDYEYDTTHNLMKDIDGNIRYYGASPNNYIYFNCDNYNNQSSSTCELWRIIGVFDDKVKLIRNDSIGTYSWDNKTSGIGSSKSSYGSNDWTDSRLMMLLNPGYESATDIYSYEGSLYWNRKAGTCYAGSSNATVSCDFTSSGLKNDITRSMIADATWSLGKLNNSTIYSDEIYRYERKTAVSSGSTLSWNGKIALMYMSDYGYATDFSKCSATLHDYGTSENVSMCRNNDWLYNNNSANQWLLTPSSSYSDCAWFMQGSVFSANTYNTKNVHPVLYLDSGLKIEPGADGSSTSPYKLIP